MTSIKQNTLYWIKSIHSGRCLDICQDNNKTRGSTIIYDYCNAANQQFIVKRNGQYYYFISKLTGKALSIEGNPYENGASIRQMDFVNGSNQMWKLVQTSHNSEEFMIMSAVGNKVLDVCGEKKGNGTPVFLYDWKRSHNQIWQFINADDGDYPLKIMGCKQPDVPSSFFGTQI